MTVREFPEEVPFYVIPLFKMTEETSSLSHNHMVALDNLGMTTRTAQFFTSFHFSDMMLMIKYNIFKIHFALKKPVIVTTFLGAGFIADFRPGLSPDV